MHSNDTSVSLCSRTFSYNIVEVQFRLQFNSFNHKQQQQQQQKMGMKFSFDSLDSVKVIKK